MAARLSALRASRTLPPGFFIFKDITVIYFQKEKINNTFCNSCRSCVWQEYSNFSSKVPYYDLMYLKDIRNKSNKEGKVSGNTQTENCPAIREPII
jgi:hypothetical protein